MLHFTHAGELNAINGLKELDDIVMITSTGALMRLYAISSLTCLSGETSILLSVSFTSEL